MVNSIDELKKTLMRTEVPTKPTMSKLLARIAVGGYYDMQEVRKSTMNRIRDVIRKKREGIPFDKVEEEKEREEFAEEYNDESLPDLLESMMEGEDEKFNEQEVHKEITKDEYEYVKRLLDIASESTRLEKKHQKVMEGFFEEPIYQEFLKHVKGIGPVYNANLIHILGYCEETAKGKDIDTASKVWAYAGLAPGQERKKGEKVRFDVDLKTLCWKIGGNLTRAGGDIGGLYKPYFYDPYKKEQIRRMENSFCNNCGKPTYKHKKTGERNTRACSDGTKVSLENFDIDYDVPDKATPPWSKGHADERAKRYMVKKFLKHYWVIARTIKNLEITDPYMVSVKGHERREKTPENAFYMLSKMIERDEQ